MWPFVSLSVRRAETAKMRRNGRIGFLAIIYKIKLAKFAKLL